ncbi:MAG: BMP family ABC transporter substrate-binding protein [Clostridia bacterium]|nr:BMP family ABC transporter substrate-binding protein [Clostridia bacterium]
MFRKIISLVLVVLMAAGLFAGLTGCTESGDTFKIGVILLHDESSTYDKNFITAVEDAQQALGLSNSQVIIKKGVPEGNECYEAARDLVAEGCKVIFADSFGHEDYMIKAAKEFKDVEFCHATGTKAHTENLANYHNAFASIYEGRYLAGIAAGLKLKAMMEADSAVVPKIGYVGAFTYAEVISGYTAFYLGVKEIVPDVTMDVQFTGSWYEETEEKNAANALINNGCVLISQHADSMGAPSACEDKNIPNVSYNGSTASSCPNTFIVSSRIDWAPYVKYICQQTMDGKPIDTDWTGTINTESVKLTELGPNAPVADTQTTIDKYKAELVAGTRHVFDTNNFTVNGEKLTSYMADVDTDAEFQGDTEVVKDGYFHESEFRSAPYFDLEIDGITRLNTKF